MIVFLVVYFNCRTMAEFLTRFTKRSFFFALIDAALVGEGGGRFLRCEKKSYRVVV